MFVDFNILNQLGSPSINSNTFANRPAAGQTGRLFVSTDTFEIYRDNGTTWDLIGGPGSSTITGTGTATQVAYFTSSQAIGSSANLFWDNTNTRLGIGTATPGAALDIHSTGIMAHFNTTSATGNTYIAFQRTGTSVWRLGDQYNAGANFFQIHNIALSNNAIEIATATNKSIFTALQTYTTGLARGNYFDYNLSVSAGGSFSSPNAITALGASLDLTLAGNATIPSGARSGLDAYNSIAFTGAGTLTHGQGTQIRAYSNITAGWAFNGSATGTVTHLAGLRALFPDNTGSAINVTNNYALLLNDQTPNTGTVTYTNRWGVYQEGASDLNYMAANLLLGSTTNNGLKLQVTGESYFSSNVGLGVTPSAWATTSNYVALQVGSSGIYGRAAAANETYLTSNTYYNAGWKYIYTASATRYDQDSGSHAWYTAPSGTAGNAISFTQAMTLNASGNLGLGVSPSAWGSLFAGGVLQVKNSSLLGYLNNTYLSANAYFTNSTDNYIASDFATRYVQASGQHRWEIAPSGTAGNAITFTQAMTLGANGNLLVGTTTDAGQRLQVSGDIYTFNSVGGGVTTLGTGSNPSIQVSNGNGYFKTYKFVMGGDNYNQYFLSSTAVGGDPIGIDASIKEDGTECQVQIGDMTAYGNGTTMAVIDAVSTIIFNSSIGKYAFSNVPQFANNAAAIAAGYTAGYIYRITGTGDLKIVI